MENFKFGRGAPELRSPNIWLPRLTAPTRVRATATNLHRTNEA